MVRAGSVQNVLVLLDLALSPLLVHRATILGDESEDAEQTESGNGFLVENVELVADGSNGETGASGEDSGLRGQGLAREGVEDRLGLLLGVLARDVRVGPGRGQVSGDGTDRKGRSEPSGAWNDSVTALRGSIGPFGTSSNIPMAR